MFKEEIDQLVNKPQPSSSEDQATNSISNLNKQLQDFQHRFKGYHHQKPFSDSQSEQQTKPSFPTVSQVQQVKKNEQQQSRLNQIKNQIKWKDSQIEQLLKLQGDGPKDKKIKQLAQKVKLLSINLEKQKTNNLKKKQDLDHTTMEATKISNVSSPNDLKQSIKLSNDGDLKNKLAQSEKQVMEMRLKNQNIKNQLNKAMRVITKQIGQDVNIDDILSQQNSWKGRQQKIEYLKGKVKQLESKLNSNAVDVSHMSGFTMMSSEKTSRQQTTLNGLSDNRRKQLENLKVQVQAVKSQNQILQGKVKALASRKGTLQTEVRQLKGEYQKKQKLFKQKSDNDDKYISLLKGENQKLKKQKDDKVVTKLVYKNSNPNEMTEKNKQIQKLKQLLTQKQTQNKKLLQKLQSGLKVVQKPKSRQVRPPSSDKTKKIIQKKIEQLQKQYMDQDNADQSITPEEQQAIYKQWKQNKLKEGK